MNTFTAGEQVEVMVDGAWRPADYRRPVGSYHRVYITGPGGDFQWDAAPDGIRTRMLWPNATPGYGPAPMPAAVDRKAEPVFSGVMAYFPLTMRAMSRLSKAGNDKHNPGEPLHWNRATSMDDADALARHLLDHAQDPTGVDPDSGELHAVSTAWRACAVSEKALEALAGTRK
jgi:hypothetical protein